MSIGPFVQPLCYMRSGSRAEQEPMCVRGHQAVSCWLQKFSVQGLHMFSKESASHPAMHDHAGSHLRSSSVAYKLGHASL